MLKKKLYSCARVAHELLLWFSFSIENFLYKKLINDVTVAIKRIFVRMIQHQKKMCSIKTILFIISFLIINTFCRF